jgi:hypothetical protein
MRRVTVQVGARSHIDFRSWANDHGMFGLSTRRKGVQEEGPCVMSPECIRQPGQGACVSRKWSGMHSNPPGNP